MRLNGLPENLKILLPIKWDLTKHINEPVDKYGVTPIAWAIVKGEQRLMMGLFTHGAISPKEEDLEFELDYDQEERKKAAAGEANLRLNQLPDEIQTLMPKEWDKTKRLDTTNNMVNPLKWAIKNNTKLAVALIQHGAQIKKERPLMYVLEQNDMFRFSKLSDKDLADIGKH